MTKSVSLGISKDVAIAEPFSSLWYICKLDNVGRLHPATIPYPVTTEELTLFILKSLIVTFEV